MEYHLIKILQQFILAQQVYANVCVVKYILSESKYGYIGSRIKEIFELYSKMFTKKRS